MVVVFVVLRIHSDPMHRSNAEFVCGLIDVVDSLIELLENPTSEESMSNVQFATTHRLINFYRERFKAAGWTDVEYERYSIHPDWILRRYDFDLPLKE